MLSASRPLQPEPATNRGIERKAVVMLSKTVQKGTTSRFEADMRCRRHLDSTPQKYLPRAVQGKMAEAEPLWKRSEAMLVKELGPEHEHVAYVLFARAVLLETEASNRLIFQAFECCSICWVRCSTSSVTERAGPARISFGVKVTTLALLSALSRIKSLEE